MRSLRFCAVTVTAAALAFVGSAGAVTTPSAIAFGRGGGTLIPYSVTIAGTGRVAAHGATVASTHVAPATLLKLDRTARSLVKTLPALTQCPGTLPDIASSWVTARTATGLRRVAVHGSCSVAFNRFYAALEAAVGLRR